MTRPKEKADVPPESSTDYDIHLDDKFGHLSLIDVGAEAAAQTLWFNQTLTTTL